MPLSLVTTDRMAPVSVLVNVTDTPGSTAPDESDAIPSIAPLAACDWANAGTTGDSSSNSTANDTRNMRRFSWESGWESIAFHQRALPDHAPEGPAAAPCAIAMFGSSLAAAPSQTRQTWRRMMSGREVACVGGSPRRAPR